MRGRQYDPKLGQFIQPDPIVQAPDYSQSWNRYAYVFNNPLKFVDPTGYETTGSDGEGSESSGEEQSSLPPGFTSPTQAKVDGQIIDTKPGDSFKYSKDGQTYMNTGKFFSPVPPGSEDMLGAMIAALNESQPHGEATNKSASLDTSKSATDGPGNTESAAKASSNSKGEGGGSSGNGGGTSLMQDLLTGAAFINMEFPDAIRTDGTGSAGGIPGGQCASCEGSPVAQWVYLGTAAVGIFTGVTKGLAKGAARGITAGSRANMPAWKKVVIDMDEVASGHMVGGRRLAPGNKKDVFPSGMTESQVERAIRDAYRHGEVLQSQGVDRVFVRGPFGSRSIEMWVNKTTKTIETAWPKF